MSTGKQLMWVEEAMPFHTFTQGTALPSYRRDHKYNDEYRRQSITMMSEEDRNDFSDFTERNSGTVVAVRQTAGVRNMMRLALEIYPKMLAKGWIHGNGGIADQAAFREAYFVSRKQISEELLPETLGCHNRRPKDPTCSQDSRCLFINGFG